MTFNYASGVLARKARKATVILPDTMPAYMIKAVPEQMFVND